MAPGTAPITFFNDSMSPDRIGYLERFLDGTEFVISGRKGSISDNKWLAANYDPLYYDMLSKHLDSSDERVRAELISLFARVGERRAVDIVREKRKNDKEIVRTACLGYLNAIDAADTMVPDLFDVLEHSSGQEFRIAAMKMGSVGRAGDVARLRRIHGQVDGEMRTQIRDTLEMIIDRDQDLRKKKDFLLSLPVFPDEKRFVSFLDNSITYLDIRYRDSVAPKRAVSDGVYSNVYNAIMKMRVRMFNEQDNLMHYPPASKKMYSELLSLIEWASDDLSSKTVERHVSPGGRFCGKCGNELRFYNGVWVCVDCGGRK